MTHFILDVDGVLTTGQYLYSSGGKQYKVFGAHDHDGLKLLPDFLTIEFVSADARGFEISKRRIVEDMGFPLTLVKEHERLSYLNTNYGLKNVIYMGDGYYDAEILSNVGLGIAPNNARIEAIRAADYVTPSASGQGAVLDACLHIIEYLKAHD